MSRIGSRLDDLKRNLPAGYWIERIISELGYACKLSEMREGRFDEIICSAIEYLFEKHGSEGAITKANVEKAENMLAELTAEAKSLNVLCVAHAHIDMNWMWGWDETVAVTLDTFRTMLDLMDEYPGFKFSQSQASVYRIVESYAPDMLEVIKRRVAEGRWEITASTWVEADKNMPNGESMTRQILYAKRYLSRLFEIDPNTLNLDFEPDTFGHSINVPEILSQGGVKYYYHCRGYEGHEIYKWKAPSGSCVICYREPLWYLTPSVRPDYVLHMPELCSKYGMNTAMLVYGVGDHGGGPARRDIERLIDMDAWPIFPHFSFGTYSRYFSEIEKIEDRLPVVEGELNFMDTGCYTSHARIKMANRMSEAVINESEFFSTAAALSAGFKYRSGALAGAWEKILFNQFHDILPGSGVQETREHAMGLFQEIMAEANTNRSLALQSIASNIDTSCFINAKENIADTVSEGAGAGYGISSFKVLQAERGRGKTRIFHIFNPSMTEREENVELVVWDWKGNIEKIAFRDGMGNPAEYQVLDSGFNNYWMHDYLRVLVRAAAPAGGYTTYVMTESSDFGVEPPFPPDPRLEKVREYVLENDHIKAVFSSGTAAITSLTDKKSGEEYIDSGRTSGVFRFIREEAGKDGTAWEIGRYLSVTDLTENVRIRNIACKTGSLRQSVSYEIAFENSVIKAEVSLDKGSTRLEYSVECDWHELGKPYQYVPQLGFHMPLSYKCENYRYDVPFGTIARKGIDQDHPANSWVLGERNGDSCKHSGNNEPEPAGSPSQGKKSVMLITDSKYGFRCVDNSISVTLIRSTFDPDTTPEQGVHKFRMALCLADEASNGELIQYAHEFNHPMSFISSRAHGGNLPLTKSFAVLLEGSAVVSAVKMPEEQGNGRKTIVRLYETEGRRTKAVLEFFLPVRGAYYVDINENRINPGLDFEINGGKVSAELLPYSVAAVCVEF